MCQNEKAYRHDHYVTAVLICIGLKGRVKMRHMKMQHKNAGWKIRDMKMWTKTAIMESVAHGPLEADKLCKQNNVTIATRHSNEFVSQLTNIQ